MTEADSAVPSAYCALEEKFRNLALLGEVTTLLHWDAATMMPPSASRARGDQLAEMARLQHRAQTDAAIPDLLSKAEDAASALSDWQQANLREMRRSYHLANALDEDLVAALTRASNACEAAWREAKKAARFEDITALLDTLLDLTRERGDAYGQALGLERYDALLELYAPGMRTQRMDPIFEDYAAFLPDFLAQVQERQNRAGPPRRPQPVAAEKQRILVDRLSAATGFSKGRGRIDVSAHPFSTGYPGDQRITVSFTEEDPMMAVMAVLHECGHAAYEAGLPPEWSRQPVGNALGMVVHESQSLSVEMQASRSEAFLSWLAGEAASVLGEDPAYEIQNFQRLQQWVEPGFIRVDADEVTYPAHVILRTRLERALLSGDLAVQDLPGAWGDEMKALLGLNVPNDRVGCLQDIHWYDGAFGYFPTYSLGAMLAAQLTQAAKDADSSIEPALADGDFSPLMAWMGNAIHRHGARLSSDDLIVQATGKPLGSEAFKRHLTQRYLGG